MMAQYAKGILQRSPWDLWGINQNTYPEGIPLELLESTRYIMTKIYIPSAGPDSWQQLLAKPEEHWRTGYSARSLACSWEEAGGFPKEIKEAINTSDIPDLGDIVPLLVIPKHKVPLPPGRISPSQNDAFVLASNEKGLISMTIEGKVEEPFGQTIEKWEPDSSPGKHERFNYLVDLLELQGRDISQVYYQLIHRTASAIIEAERFHADTAVMLVHSFSQSYTGFEEFCAFAGHLGVKPKLNRLHSCGKRSGIELYIGWVVGDAKYLKR